MTDQWNEQNVPETPQEPVAPQQPVPPQEPVAPPQPAAPQQPATPQPPISPMNGWSSDGSYRYVPPRSDAPTPPSAQGGYQSPCSGAPNSPRYTAPQQTNPYYTGPVGGPAPVPPAPPQPPKKKSGWVTAVAILCALALVAGVVALVYTVAELNGDDLTDGKPPVSDGTDTPDTDDGAVNENAPSLEINTWDTDDGGLSTEEIVKRNYDSTVVITMYSQTNNFYFGESNLTEVGGATGIVMKKDGYIITNRHCVIDEQTGKKYDRIDVTTYDGTVYEDATVIGADEATDLAVIRIKADNLTPAQFGNSDELAVGARVIALGNAAGLSWTATQGIVSAKARDVYDDTGYAIQCLQVDVAINSGNSGGPLLNKQGMVVGINSAKIFAAGYEGLGFSIPINEAKPIIDSLLKYGYVKGRVALGITGQTIDAGEYRGFMIASIEPGSAMAETEAQVNDLIVEVDGVKITDYGTLRSELAKRQVGDKVKLKLLRSNRRTGQVTSHYVTVTLKEQTAQ